ncbi:O-antigen/teichoic acid export membrane protein [Salinibacter ruber]|uniref:lipopolysaccharide biosynthesis protein n=1 Tax=Salinibacter ruber TaxID=146919 RepID=UPI002166D8DB|nr:polysaccharide biosynthesis C-terminal domain-containing protein [Salinibacter ruber]MCS3939540.1 O-antigen/teichoic acid export membrane protein [Salinibacter ruber]
MQKKLRIYIWGAGTGAIAEIIQKITGFASVWLLNQTLVKSQYGNYEFALALVSMALILGSGGLQNVAMYRLSRLKAPPEKLAGRELAGSLLSLSLLIAAAIALLLVAALPIVTSIAGKPSLRFWIGGLVLLIPLRVARGIYKNWYEARQLVAESIFYSKIAPTTAKVAFLSISWMAWPTPLGVVVAILFSESCPLAAWYAKTPVNLFPRPRLLSWWDIKYASKLMMTRSLSKTNKRADILMMGGLATSAATAEYVIASKLSIIVLASHKIMNKILRPRIGKFISDSEWLKAETEYDKTRLISLSFSLLYGAIVAYFGVFMLSIFGDYQSAYTATMILVATYIITVSFGMNGEYLNIAGYASWSLIIALLTLFINISLNYMLIPALDEVGASIAMLVSIIFTNSLCAAVVYKLDGIKVYSIDVLAYTLISSSVAILTGFGIMGNILASIILIFISATIILRNRLFVKRLVETLV